jgi:hypothetical protein
MLRPNLYKVIYNTVNACLQAKNEEHDVKITVNQEKEPYEITTVLLSKKILLIDELEVTNTGFANVKYINDTIEVCFRYMFLYPEELSEHDEFKLQRLTEESCKKLITISRDKKYGRMEKMRQAVAAARGKLNEPQNLQSLAQHQLTPDLFYRGVDRAASLVLDPANNYATCGYDVCSPTSSATTSALIQYDDLLRMTRTTAYSTATNVQMQFATYEDIHQRFSQYIGQPLTSATVYDMNNAASLYGMRIQINENMPEGYVMMMNDSVRQYMTDANGQIIQFANVINNIGRAHQIKRHQAENKALLLLKKLVDQKEYEKYMKEGFIDVKASSGAVYRVWKDKMIDMYVPEDTFKPIEELGVRSGNSPTKEIVEKDLSNIARANLSRTISQIKYKLNRRLCIHSKDHILPNADEVIAKIMLAKTDEHFLLENSHYFN